MPFRTTAVQDDPTQRKKKTFQLLATLLDCDRRWTAREIAAEVGVCHKTLLHIVHDILGYHKLAVLWIPHEISEVQQWHRCTIAQALLDRYQSDGSDFLERIIAMDGTWACQSNEWKHPGSPHPKKVRTTQCAAKVMFIVVYDIDEVIGPTAPCCSSKADSKRCFLLHITTTPPSSRAQE